MKKAALIYNEKSGKGAIISHLTSLENKCKAKDVKLGLYKAGDESYNFLKNEDLKEYEFVAVAGGDGSINITVNLLKEFDKSAPLAILPSGTANDFAYALGVPANYDRAMDIALRGRKWKIDLPSVNGKYFINVAAIGNLIDLSQKTPPHLKQRLGMLAYYMQGLKELKNIKNSMVTIETPDKIHKEDIIFLVVLNGRGAGGFRDLLKGAKLDDGKLDVLAFKKMNLAELSLIFSALKLKREIKSDKIIHFQSSEFTIKSSEPLGTDVDGEKGADFPLVFKTGRESVEFIVSDKFTG